MDPDVTQESSPAETPKVVSVEQVEVTQPQQTEEVAQEGQQAQTPEVPDLSGIDATFPEPGQGNQPVEEVDSMGVPYKNRYHEMKRKYEDTSTKISNMESILQNLQTSQQETQQTYTIADVEEYIRTNKDELSPAQIGQLEQEKSRLLEERIVGTIREENKKQHQAIQAEQIKVQSLQAVAQSFPDAFAKDASGKIIGWDNSSPLTQRIMQYGQDPSISSRPDGLIYAAKLAYADTVTSGLLKANSKVATQQAEIGELQRKTAIEGNGVGNVAGVPTRVSMINEAANSGTRKAARTAFQQMMVDSGRLKK